MHVVMIKIERCHVGARCSFGRVFSARHRDACAVWSASRVDPILILSLKVRSARDSRVVVGFGIGFGFKSVGFVVRDNRAAKVNRRRSLTAPNKTGEN